MDFVSNKKLICFSGKYYLFGKGPKLYVSESAKGHTRALGTLPVGAFKQAMGTFRLFARTLRLEVRCGIFVDDNIALVSYHGAVYRVDCEQLSITLEHSYREGMNNPLCFTRIADVPGFANGIYYGEYFLNHDSEPVSIYRRNSNGSWQQVYTFAAGQIYHVHGIVPSKKDEAVYVLTGDKDAESGIYKFTDDFHHVETVVTGMQAYRSCVALPVANGMLYTTDTPLETNYLYHLDYDIKEISPVSEIAGPCIYGRIVSDTEMIFSTSVEPDSRIEGLKYQFSYKLGPGVKDRYTHLYHVIVAGDEIDIKEIFTAKKDILPMGAGQFGTLMFPDGEGQVFVTGQALRKYDNKTLIIDEI